MPSHTTTLRSGREQSVKHCYNHIKQNSIMLSTLLKPKFISLLLLIITCIPQLKAEDPIIIVNDIEYGIIVGSNYEYAYVSKCPSTYTGAAVIPESVVYGDKSYHVTEIGMSAFSRCSGLTSVTIPPSVTFINEGAFEGCSGLTSVMIPSSVTNIGELAFEGCSGLTSVTIPPSVTYIDERAFKNCTGLTSAIIEGKSMLNYSVFDGCTLKPLLLKDVIFCSPTTFSGLNENSVIYAPKSQVEEIKKYFPNTYAHD